MDYNARFYDSSLNHWVQPDTIIPNPYSSQDWNRFSYVQNNPIRYNDPSGHKYCDSEDPEECTRLSNSIEDVSKVFHITWEGNWDSENQAAVISAVERVGEKFASLTKKDDSSSRAFIDQFGYMTFGFGKKECDASYGGCTHNKNRIGFITMSGAPDLDNNKFNTFAAMEMNVVHELGHAYDLAIASKNNSVGLSNVFSIDIVKYRGLFLRADLTAERMWQQHPSPYKNVYEATAETVADTFIAWVYNGWNTSGDNKWIVDVAVDWANANFTPRE
jgi:hypothetical protein